MNEVYCQSCGMPLSSEKLLGSEKDGSKSAEYCLYCYENGAFTAPDITMEQMIEVCVPHMTAYGMKEEEARNLMNNALPQLKRWKK
jgi:NAD-dependent SIR2 family protein deacetylase